jgi:hypothetical protein
MWTSVVVVAVLLVAAYAGIWWIQHRPILSNDEAKAIANTGIYNAIDLEFPGSWRWHCFKAEYRYRVRRWIVTCSLTINDQRASDNLVVVIEDKTGRIVSQN